MKRRKSTRYAHEQQLERDFGVDAVVGQHGQVNGDKYWSTKSMKKENDKKK